MQSAFAAAVLAILSPQSNCSIVYDAILRHDKLAENGSIERGIEVACSARFSFFILQSSYEGEVQGHGGITGYACFGVKFMALHACEREDGSLLDGGEICNEELFAFTDGSCFLYGIVSGRLQSNRLE